MTITVDAIYEAGVLKPLTPLPELPEHTKVRLTVEAFPSTAPPPSVIATQRQHRIALPPSVARAIGDGHAYDLFES
jgi:predicted DNA-binding antitoxin AbrB/MazE fold protein